MDEQLDHRKFKELVVYVTTRTIDDETVGSIKLNKILFFADFLAFAELGHPITAAPYQKQKLGPLARAFLPLVDELVRDGDVQVIERPYYSQTQKRVLPLRRADLSRFSAEEIAIVEEVISRLRGLRGMDVSELSHHMVGWQLAEIGEDIPYETVFLNEEQPSDFDIDRGLELAREYGWD